MMSGLIGSRVKRQRRNIVTKTFSPSGEVIDHSELRVGMLVWGYWEEDRKWYLGIMCETPDQKLYCQYADGDQDYGEELQRDWKLHYDQTAPHAIVVRPLEVNDEQEEEGKEVEEGEKVEEGEEGEDEKDEDYEDDVEDEDGVEVLAEEAVKVLAEEADEVLAEEAEDAAFFPRQAEFRESVANKFGKRFASDIIKALKSVYDQTPPNTRSPVTGIARKVMALCRRPESLPTIYDQIVKEEMTAADVVEKAHYGPWEEPEQTRQKKERLKAHFLSRTVADDANDMVGFCGSMVPRKQLETGVW